MQYPITLHTILHIPYIYHASSIILTPHTIHRKSNASRSRWRTMCMTWVRGASALSPWPGARRTTSGLSLVCVCWCVYGYG
ncbi:hypothetical protein EON63_04715 [archaeon]|nr:MAG: hypothetical protein EON63_04715 [archaeon]